MRSFEFANFVREDEEKLNSSIHFEKENEQITPYFLSVLEFNIHKTNKGIKY